MYEGHTGIVQSVCLDPDGQWLASVAGDCSVKLWEVSTGRCVATVTLSAKPVAVAFSPNTSYSLLAIAM